MPHWTSMETHQSNADIDEKTLLRCQMSSIVLSVSICSTSIDLAYFTKRGIPTGESRCMRCLGTSLLYLTKKLIAQVTSEMLS